MLNYGIIGCGMMGREHIRNISLLSECRVTAIFEPDLKMQKLALAIAPSAIIYNSIKELITRASLDCLVIATPNFCHINDLTEITKHTNIPLLIEKPVVTKLSDIRKLNALQKNYAAPIWVAMEYRFMPALKEFTRQVSSVTGGIKMLSIREHRYPFLQKVNNWNRFNEYSGGTFVEKCCHFFDLMRLITGSNPVQVMAVGGQACNHLTETYQGKRANIWDNGYVIVEFENDSRAMLELCMFSDISTFQEEISAIGEKGKIECKLIGPKRFWATKNLKQPESQIVISDRLKKTIKEEHFPVELNLLEAGDHNGSTFFQHKEFQKVVLAKGNVEVTVNDGVWAVKMGLAAQISAIEKRSVLLSEMV